MFLLKLTYIMGQLMDRGAIAPLRAAQMQTPPARITSFAYRSGPAEKTARKEPVKVDTNHTVKDQRTLCPLKVQQTCTEQPVFSLLRFAGGGGWPVQGSTKKSYPKAHA